MRAPSRLEPDGSTTGTEPTDLLRLPTDKLLGRFGAGKATPGSGAAGALTGLLAGKLVVTVADLTLSKPELRAAHPRLRYIAEQVRGKTEPALTDAFRRDCEVFERVVQARRARDAAADGPERQRHQRVERDLMREATEIPLAVGGTCLELAGYANVAFDEGYRAVRGDSGAAGSIAISGAFTSLFIAFLNLKKFRDAAWAKQARARAEVMYDRLQEAQVDLFRRVADLQEVKLEDLQFQFDFEDERGGGYTE